jgi:hypothetical protein
VIVAVLAGAELGGVAGMFLAIPIVAIVTVVSRHWRTWHGSDAAAETPLPSAALASPISPSRQAPALSDTSPETSA